MYSEKTINRFKNPKFAREMQDADAVGEEGNMKCGDAMRVFIKVKDNTITDISFMTYGCVAAIASTDAMCEIVKGMTLDEAYNLDYKKIIDKLEEVPKIKYHCSILGTHALKKAIENYRKNH